MQTPIDSAGGLGFVCLPKEDPSKQPVEVWVRSGGLGFLLGKTQGWIFHLSVLFLQKWFPVPLPITTHCLGCRTLLVRLDTLKLATRPCLNLALIKRTYYYYVLPGFMPYDARFCLYLCCLDLIMSCAHTCAALTIQCLAQYARLSIFGLVYIFVYYLKEKFYSFL